LVLIAVPVDWIERRMLPGEAKHFNDFIILIRYLANGGSLRRKCLWILQQQLHITYVIISAKGSK